MTKLTIHHFFDIIRDYGANKELEQHKYGHSYHFIGKKIYLNEIKEFELIVGCDDICNKCSKLVNQNCIDFIDHRSDFKKKEEFNNYLDKRIMDTMGMNIGQIMQVKEIIERSNLYLENIYNIYQGNDLEHIEIRKKNVSLGIKKKKKELLGMA